MRPGDTIQKNWFSKRRDESCGTAHVLLILIYNSKLALPPLLLALAAEAYRTFFSFVVAFAIPRLRKYSKYRSVKAAAPSGLVP